MGCIAQYSKCGLKCEDSEDIVSETSEDLHRQFVSTHPHSTPSLGVIPFEFWDELDIPETMMGHAATIW